jgi:hypothetical protein
VVAIYAASGAGLALSRCAHFEQMARIQRAVWGDSTNSLSLRPPGPPHTSHGREASVSLVSAWLIARAPAA